MPTALLGNPKPLERGNPVPGGEQVTLRIMPESGWTHDEHMRDLTHHRDGVWLGIADEPPSWVASDDAVIAQAIADRYNCPVISLSDARERFLNLHPHPGMIAHIQNIE